MTIHAFPAPSIKLIFKTFFTKNNVGLFNSEKAHEYFFSRGTCALAAAIEYVMVKRRIETIKVWLPGYFCAEALVAFEGKNVRCYFYPINKNLEPDWFVIEHKAKSESPDIFILVHYFGFINSIVRAHQFSKRNNCELIEDACHVVKLEQHPHLTIYSPRKIYSIPEGGILISKETIASSITTSGEPTSSRAVWSWLIKRLIQKLLVNLRTDWHSLAGFAVHWRAEQPITDLSCNRLANNYTKKIVTEQVNETERIIDQRRKNYASLAQVVEGKESVKPFFSHLPDNVCPYVFPLLVHSNKSVLERKLHLLGIPASSWPALPLAVNVNQIEHSNAIWLKQHILLLPLHQDLKSHQIEYMSKCIEKYVL